VIKGNKD